MKQDSNFEKKKHVSNKLLLTKRRFKAFKKTWDGMASDEASELFYERLEEQSSDMVDSDGEPRVREKGVSKERTETGTASEIITQRDVGPEAKRFRHGEETHRGAGRDSARPEAKRPRQVEEAHHGAASASDDEGLLEDDVVAETAASVASTKSKTPTLTSSRVAAHASAHGNRSSASAAPSVAASVASPSVPRAKEKPSEAPLSARKMSAVEVMQAKKDLKLEMAKTIDNAAHNKGILKRLKDASDSLSEVDKSKIEGDTAGIVGSIRKAMDLVKAELDRTDSVRAMDFAAHKEKFATLRDNLAELIFNGEEHYTAIMFVLGEKAKGEKTEKNQARYAKQKVANKLALGGFGPAHAKRLMNMIGDDDAAEEMQAIRVFHPAELNMEKVSIWTAEKPGDSAGTGSPINLAEKFQGPSDLMSTLQTKLASVAKSLTNPKSTGAVARIDMDVPVNSWINGKNGESLNFYDGPGSSATIVGFKKFAWRFGPQAHPLQGIASIVKALDRPFVLQLCDVQQLISRGISIGDMHSFLETASGHTYFKSSCALVSLEPWAACVIPNGYVVVPVSGICDEAVPNTAKVDKKQASDELDLYYYLTVPLGSQSLMKQLPRSTIDAIGTFNEAYYDKQRTTKIWSEKSDYLKRLFADLGVEISVSKESSSNTGNTGNRGKN